MAKQSGLGDQFYVDGFNLSGDVGSLSAIRGGHAVQDVTGIDKSARERVLLAREGSITFSSFFNDSAAQAFTRLKTLPRADVLASYLRGTGIGSPMASLVAKQLDYNPTRASSGALTIVTQAQSNGYGIEWGEQLTAGIRTDTAATSPATGLDTAASLAFGLQAYLHVFAFTGTSVTVTLEDSADNSSFAAIGGGVSFTAATAVGGQRIATANTVTVRRYVRAITTGTFSNVQFVVQLTKNATAGVVF